MFARRKFLGMFAASPLAARAVAAEAAATLAGVSVGAASIGAGSQCQPSNPPDATPAQARAALRIPSVLSQVRSDLFEDNRFVTRIDPDIAVHRSFSLNAMITFQRQRNVERDLERMQKESWPYRRIKDAILQAVGVKLF